MKYYLCLVCKKKFQGIKNSALACSLACRLEREKNLQRAKRKGDKALVKKLQTPVEAPKVQPINCKYCNTLFEPFPVDSVFCSELCFQQHFAGLAAAEDLARRKERKHYGLIKFAHDSFYGDLWKDMEEGRKYGMSNCCPLDTYSSMDVGYGL